MSAKRKQAWNNYKEKFANKRGRKDDKGVAGKSGMNGCITVQRLSANVEGKCQKYSRIGPLTLVQLEKEPTLENIKSACKAHFSTNLECDVLAGERGPSFSNADQIKNWKVIHVRFIEGFFSQETEKSEIQRYKSEPCEGSPSKEIQKHCEPSSVPKSVSVSVMLKMGKLIVPENKVVTLKVEEFSIEQGMTWLESIEVAMSVQCKPFAEGAFREAYMAKVFTGLPKGDYVLKKYKKDEAEGIASLFDSIESHTRTSVQLNALAKNFAEKMQLDAPFEEFGNSFAYNKV